MTDLAQRFLDFESAMLTSRCTSADRPDPDGELPLSRSQRRLWFPSNVPSGNPAYWMTYAVSVDRAVTPEEAQRASDAIVGRHSVLRTRFGLVGGEPVQTFGGDPTPTVEVVDAGVEHVVTVARDVATRLASEPADLIGGGLYRLVLVTGRDAHSALILRVHHLLCDGWSLALLVDEFARFLTATDTDSPGERPRQYWESIHDEHTDAAIAGRRVTDRKDARWWSDYLDGATLVPQAVERHPRTVRAELPLGAIDGPLVDRVAADLGVSPFVLFLTALDMTIRDGLGTDGTLIASDIAGRGPSDRETVGFFTNQVLIRCPDVEPGTPARDRCVGVGASVRDVVRHAGLPYQDVVQALPGGVPVGGADPFVAKLVYVDYRFDAARNGGASLRRLDVPVHHKNGRELNIWRTQDGYTGYLQGSEAAFGRRGVAATLDDVLDALESIWLEPDRPAPMTIDAGSDRLPDFNLEE